MPQLERTKHMEKVKTNINQSLTIAIPTYNRLQELSESLDRVIKYSEGKNIEILVSDNASTDGTKEYMLMLQKNNPMIKYYRNPKNLGFDGNFLNCLEKANGEYIWLLGDDDFMLDGAVDSIFLAMSKNPVCIHLNSSGIAQKHPIKFGKPRFKYEGIKEYQDKNKFFKEMGIYCTFLSTLVYRTEFVKNIENKEQYFNTNLLQSHIFFEIMKNRGIYILNTKNCLAATGNKKINYDLPKTWIKGYSDLLLNTAVKCGFNEKVVNEELQKDLDTTIYRFVITFRRTCNDDTWDWGCIWQYIERYPRLINKYKTAVNCPKQYLIILQILDRAKKFLNLRQRIL